MKKILFILAMLFIINPVYAKSIKVQAMKDFSTANLPKVWKTKVLETFTAESGLIVHQNTVIEGDIVNVKSPQRLKRNATFRFVPKTYYDPQNGVEKPVKRDFEGKYSATSNLDKKSLAKCQAFKIISSGS